MQKEVLEHLQRIFTFSEKEMEYIQRRFELMPKREQRQVEQNLIHFNIDSFLDLL